MEKVHIKEWCINRTEDDLTTSQSLIHLLTPLSAKNINQALILKIFNCCSYGVHGTALWDSYTWAGILCISGSWTLFHHHYQSLNCKGRWGTTDNFATSFLHFSLEMENSVFKEIKLISGRTCPQHPEGWCLPLLSANTPHTPPSCNHDTPRHTCCQQLAHKALGQNGTTSTLQHTQSSSMVLKNRAPVLQVHNARQMQHNKLPQTAS